MIGDIIDKYQIIKKIGEGGMATVFQGRHTALNRDVAIKIIHPGLAQNERNRKRFAREAKAIEKLDHKNIVKIWDYSEDLESDDGYKSCYIITELVQGLNLSQLMAEQEEIPSEVIALIGIEVCNALAYAHSKGFIHRDIKPDNIMLRTDGAIKLLDFGIARFAEEDSLTLTKSLVGSPAFMSPEQAMDESEGALDHRSDLFSLGIVLFQLATGELPFQGSNPSIVLKNIIDNRRSQAHSITPQISLTLGDCIEGLLQTNRDLRLPDAQSVAHCLRQVWTEADLDMLEEQWSLRYWLADPISYRNRLNEHLKTVLLHKGQRLTEQGKQLDAQRYLNRLLILDPDNDHVFELLQNMHTGVDTPAIKQPSIWIYALPLVAIGGIVWGFRPSPPAPVVSVQVSESPQNVETIIQLEEKVNPTSIEQNGATGSSTDLEPPRELPRLKRQKKRFTNKIPTITGLIKATDKSSESSKIDNTVAQSGLLTISIPNAWAEIWIDGKNYGRTGQVKPISLSTGTYELKLVNPYSVAHIESIEIIGDQTTHIEVRSLKRKPARLIFASTLSPECIVQLDNTSMGEIGVLEYQLVIDRPNLPHELALDCPDNTFSKEIGQLTPGSSMPIRF